MQVNILHAKQALNGAVGNAGCGRVRLLAHYRNQLLNAMLGYRRVVGDFIADERLPKLTEPDYVLMVDLDLVTLGTNHFDVDLIASVLRERFRQPWRHRTANAICAMGMRGKSKVLGKRKGNRILTAGHYFDTKALETIPGNHRTTVLAGDASGLIKHSDADPVEVRSCFGGLVAYDWDVVANSGCEYNTTVRMASGSTYGWPPPGTGCECEHLGYHRCLRGKMGARFEIDPKLWLVYDR